MNAPKSGKECVRYLSEPSDTGSGWLGSENTKRPDVYEASPPGVSV